MKVTHYLFLAIPVAHLEKAKALGVAAWLGTTLLPEKGTEIDKGDLILGLKTVLLKRQEFTDKTAFDSHANQMKPLLDRDEKGVVTELPWLVSNWGIDAEVWRTVSQAVPTYASLDLFFWLIPIDGKGEVQTNHPRIKEGGPKDIRRQFIEEIKTSKPRV